jgi:maltose alpha-D-glucosyltransferase/alpha-amylase
MDSGATGYYFVIFRVDLTPSGEATYFTVFREVPETDRDYGMAALRGLESQGHIFGITEATNDPGFLRFLMHGFANSEIVNDHGTSLSFQASEVGNENLDPERIGTIRPVNTEQSNTSVIIDDRYILKIYRNSKEGQNPDYAVPLQLVKKNFIHTPAPVGICTLSKEGSRRDLMSLFQFIPGSRDCWSVMTGMLKTYLTSHGGDAPALMACRSLAEQLGKLTADLHLSLSSIDMPDFIPVAPDTLDHGKVVDRIRKLQNDALKVTKMAHHTGSRNSSLAAKLSDQLASSRVRVPTDIDDELKIRIHGDYHLGQILQAGEFLYVIDFEGEPSRTMQERNEKWFPEKDVAGMLRSLDYAVNFSFKTANVAHISDNETEDLSRDLQEHFLETYLRYSRKGIFINRRRETFNALLGYFIVEKALYELVYELNNRPDWADIPMKYLLKTLR